MKKVLLTVAVLATLAQADDVVHYDKDGKKESIISKPNHPTTDLYTK